MKKMLTIACVILINFTAVCQTDETEVSSSDTLRKDALNVFMDATNYLKERITYVNYVRDRKVADLVIVSTSEQTGSGGTGYTLFLTGQGDFAGMSDTLKYTLSPDETLEHQREKELHTLKLGLMRYIIKTPLAKYMEIGFSEPLNSQISTDNWNSWVFNTNVTGWSNAVSSSKTLDIYGSATASKVTDEWKYYLNVNYSYSESEYIYNDYVAQSIHQTRSANTQYVKSINDHWSTGITAGILSSLYSNYDYKTFISPGIEYNIYPYSESTSRQFRLLYRVGYFYSDYVNLTQYDKLKEGIYYHSITSSYEIIKKWGSVDLTLEWSNHLRNFAENEFSIYNDINWRIAKGLSVTSGVGFSFVNDQINIEKGDVSSEDLLLETRELLTDYQYYFHFGFSYTFGSIYNNTVNPRFGNKFHGKTVIVY